MIRNVLVGSRTLVIIVLLVTLTSACGGGGQDSAEKGQDQEEQLFATDPFRLESGVAIVKMTHQGEGNFVVNLLSATQEEIARGPEPIEFSGDQNGGSNTEVSSALADEKGSVRISRAVNIPVAGEHLFDVKADGPWTIEVEQPHPSSAPRTTSFSGNDNAATPFFRLSSRWKEVTITNPLQGNLVISLLDENGNEVKPIFANNTDEAKQYSPENISETINIDEEGIYLFNVQADGLWTIEVADVERPANAEQPSPTEGDTNAPLSFGIVVVLLINLVWVLILAIAIKFGRRT